MPVSSNTLIHFTRSIEILVEILKSDFHPRFCLEDYGFIFSDSRVSKIALPMVCFCDIPLHLVKDHMKEYGKYGIGLRKSWGLKNGLCPVHYITNGSHVLQNFTAIYNEISNAKSVDAKLLSPIWNHLAFMKPHEGVSHINKSSKTFYDEREWRYFPNTFSLSGLEDPALIEDDFNNISKRTAANELLKSISLPYLPEDIKYIIVDKESEIPELIAQIDKIKTPKFPPLELSTLKTKIICSEYMFEDF